MFRELLDSMYPDTGGPVGGGVAVNEDCLVLNVWTPPADGEQRPVMVWLHGGAFVSGTGAELMFHGDHLAARADVVVVTLNHRLGVLGFLDLSAVHDRFADSRNLGMLDIVAALRWVRENIAAFGGDPENVTIFGQSGGGFKVCTLLAMPAASDLFHKAIVQSGPGLRANEPADAEKVAADLLAHLDIDPHSLQDVPVDALIAAQVSMMAGGVAAALRLAPVLDETTLPRHPFDPLAPPSAANVPLLIGTTADDASMMLCSDPEYGSLSDEGVRLRLRMFLGERSEDVFGVYRAKHMQASPTRLLARIVTDAWFRRDSVAIADRKAAHGQAPVFTYVFAYESPVCGGVLGACHSLDIPFVFDTVDRIPYAGDSQDRFTVAAAMRDAWAAFARSGNPSHGAVPAWPAYAPERGSTMVIDTEWRAEGNLWADELNAIADAPSIADALTSLADS